MTRRWFYTRDGTPHGPYSEERVKDLIARKDLLPDDWVWEEGKERQEGGIAEAEFDFSAPPPKVTAALDWLADVAAESKPGPTWSPSVAKPLPTSDSPAWLEDLQLWIALDSYVPVSKQKPEPTPVVEVTPPAKADATPDWLQGLAAPEVPKKPAPVVAPVVKDPAAEAAERMRQMSGFDPDTGRILDPIRFRQWQKEKASGASIATATTAEQPAVSNASIFEVFRRGRVAIDGWIDDDANSLRIMHADVEEIKKQPAIQAILAEFTSYGSEIQDKLLRHLEFMVDNRRKYLTALKERKF